MNIPCSQSGTAVFRDVRVCVKAEAMFASLLYTIGCKGFEKSREAWQNVAHFTIKFALPRVFFFSVPF